MKHYQYQPIHGVLGIRLLVLYPGVWKDPINCELVLGRLPSSSSGNREPNETDFVPYEALSYVWGDAAQRVPLHCGDSILEVTTNLHTALLYLRDTADQKVLWIDAICLFRWSSGVG